MFGGSLTFYRFGNISFNAIGANRVGAGPVYPPPDVVSGGPTWGYFAKVDSTLDRIDSQKWWSGRGVKSLRKRDLDPPPGHFFRHYSTIYPLIYQGKINEERNFFHRQISLKLIYFQFSALCQMVDIFTWMIEKYYIKQNKRFLHCKVLL